MGNSTVLRISLSAVVACSVLVYILFINNFRRVTFSAMVGMDGTLPESLRDEPWTAPNTVLLYRAGRNGVVCFDAFHSKELHDRLAPKSGKPVAVEFDTYSDFGKVRGYNVHSVDGMVLANGQRLVKPEYSSSSGVMSSGSGTAGAEDCW